MITGHAEVTPTKKARIKNVMYKFIRENFTLDELKEIWGDVCAGAGVYGELYEKKVYEACAKLLSEEDLIIVDEYLPCITAMVMVDKFMKRVV